MMTSFTRLAIVLSLVRTALGTQQMPPNQIIIGLALLLDIFYHDPCI
jgi:flagellar biosynthetic protein FliP